MIENRLDLDFILIFIVAGMISCFVYWVFSIFKIITKRQILVVNILDFFFVMISGFLFIFMVFKLKNGEFAFFEAFLFVFGMLFAEFSIKNLFTSPIKWVYNKITLRKAKKSFPGFGDMGGS